MAIEVWALFALAITVASFSPGPNVLIVVINTLAHGPRGALFTIAGNLVCLFCVAFLAAVGVGSMIAAAPFAFTTMKIAGGLYLAWLGYKMIRSSFGPQSQINIDQSRSSKKSASATALMSEAFLVSASNPKAILFLSAVFPQFLDNSVSLVPQFTIMFVTIIFLVSLIHSFYAVLASSMRNRPISIRVRRWMARATGTTFIGLGVGVAFSK